MFLDFLLTEHVITEEQYNKVLTELPIKYEGNTFNALIGVGLSEDALAQAKAAFYKIPYKKVIPKDIAYDVLRYISEEAARHYFFMPLEFKDGVLSVGVTEPENMEAMNSLQFI